MVGYKIEGARFEKASEHRWPVKDNESHVGFVSASAWSPRLEENIGVGLVETRFAEPGTKVTVQTAPGTDMAAIVSALPFAIPA